MNSSPTHEHRPDVSFDGGSLDCGNGLLLLIRRNIDPMKSGELLEIRSTEDSVESDLPSWCRLTGNTLVSWTRNGQQRSYLVCKGAFDAIERDPPIASSPQPVAGERLQDNLVQVNIPDTLPSPIEVPPVPPLSVMSIGSWPRPRWMLDTIHRHLEAQVDEAAFQEAADDAVRLCIAAQERAGVSVVTDGEQRRDSYASFVGGILDNVQLIPLADLAAMVDDPQKFEAELRALDVPARDVRHPVVLGKLGRSKPLAQHELTFAQSVTDTPVKVALPGPYLLTRTMWMDCLRDLPYQTREELAVDVVRVLREELHHLLAQGAAIVQFDEPVLTEVVFSGPSAKRSFMCGALSEKGDSTHEIAFAVSLMNELIKGLPEDRIAVHVCRGNWTKDEKALLSGDYRALSEYLTQVNVGILFLELSTPRAGEMQAVGDLKLKQRIGIGAVNPRMDRVETVDEVTAHAKEAIRLFGSERVLLNSDCGFATFADNPVASASIAEAKLRVMVEASRRLQER